MKFKEESLGAKLIRLFKPFLLLRWWRRPDNEITVVFLSKGHLEIQKAHFSPHSLWLMKIGGFALVMFLALSAVFFISYLVWLPHYSVTKSENRTLRQELTKIQYHLDTLETSVERMTRFDQKLRAITEVDKAFAKIRGPIGQGGVGGPSEEEVFDFGDFKVSGAELAMGEESEKFLDRRQFFLIQKIYSWMKRLYKDSSLEEQSIEELFEVLKGRELQLLATPSIMPVRGWVTSRFGYRLDPFTGRRALHRGMDIASRKGAAVVSPAEGVVTFAGRYGSFGNTVMVFHGYGVSTLYAHTDTMYVKVGQKVRRGEMLASVGSTGRSTGSHLHYEVIVHGVPVNPDKYILDRSL